MRGPFATLVAGALVVAPLVADLNVDRLRSRAGDALAIIDGEITVDGLSQPVEVIRDRWGVPHIYATTLDDLFVAQGFVAAQDRLWQLEIWKRTAEGRLAEILGPAAVERDTFARLLRYRGDLEAEWTSYAPETRRIVEAFVRGVNAQVALVNAQPEKLPIEFQITGARPSTWTPDTVISRMAGYVMTRNADTEVSRAILAQKVGAARVAEWMPPEPAVPITVPEGLALSDITADVLRLADAAEAPLPFEGIAAARRAAWGLAPLASEAFAPFATRRSSSDTRPPALAKVEAFADRYATVGSNNWVVAGSRSASGKPLLANDPHRAITLPSLRYTVHLNGPGWNVIGAGEPAVPGVAAGHNERVAFGFTIVGIDQQDLYVEQLDPGDHDRYRYRGEWEPVRIEREELRVAGEAAPRALELRFTRHGPVVHVDKTRHRAYALRWVGSEPGTAGYLASLSLNVARSWPEFLAAAARWKVPSENLIYADVDGNIGWVAAGMAPIRSNWNGLLPVPGHEGRFEWNGFLGVGELPQAYNPRHGFIATANHNILPRDYSKMLGYEWSPPHRYRRIVEVLSRPGTFTRADFERLQHDETSLPARAIVEALRVAATVTPPSPQRAEAVRGLLAWDSVLDQHSGAAALYELWLPHLRRAFARATTAEADRAVAPEMVSLERLLELLRKPTQAQLALLVGDSIDAAIGDARRLMGDDRSSWAWGRIHRAHFTHPLAFDPAGEAVMNLPPVPRGGDATTVNNTGFGQRQVHGASFREVIDLADWDKSTVINVPGASGQPTSRFYDNLLPLWAAGDYHPLVFSRPAVERAAASRLWLKPAGWTASLTPSPADGEGAPTLPDFLGTLVNFDRAAGRLAVCTREAGSGLTIGARKVARTYVWVVERNQARQLGSTAGSCDPAWSPDGSRLAVVTVNGLWTYSPELDEPRQLAETRLPRQPKDESDYTAFARPRWSPDGQRIAYIVTNGTTSWVEVVAVSTGRTIYRSDPDTYAFEWTVDPHVLKIGPRQVRLP